MATRTSVGSGDWSASGTWDTGVPADGDTVVIAAGHTVTFDVDQSAFSTGVTLTCNGTFQCKNTGGPYVLKCGGNVTVNSGGQFLAGTEEIPLPYAVKFTVNLNGAKKITGAGTVALYCTEPTIKTVLLSAAEAAGQTALSVDTDVTGDSQWAAGAKIRIDGISGTLPDSEERTILSVSAAEITVTSGITNAKAAGALVHLIDRNIKVTGATGSAFESASSLKLAVELSGNTNGFYSCSGLQISGGTISGNTYGIYYSSGLAKSSMSNSTELYVCHDLILRDTSMTGTEHSGYNGSSAAPAFYSESINHDGVAGAFKSWSRGGITVSCVDPTGCGNPGWLQMMCESSTYQIIVQQVHEIQPNEWLYVDVRMRKDTSMAWLPRIQIVDAFDDPLVRPAASYLAETVMPSDVNDETVHLAASYFNSESIRRKVLIRVAAKNATGNVYVRVKKTRGYSTLEC